MKKGIIIVLVLGLLSGIVIFSLDWGTVESEIQKSEITVDELKLNERTTFVDLNGLDVGSHIANTLKNDNLELLFNIDGLKKTTGRFNELSVNLEVTENADSSKLFVSINAASIFTNNSTRDDALISEEYFNVTQFPKIEFISDSIFRGDSTLLTKGSLNFMGKSNDLTFPMVILGEGINDAGVNFTAFEGQFDFDRTKYGMIEEKGIGNIVHISFYCELIRRD